MTLTLDWVDSDGSTVLFSFNDPDGSKNNAAIGIPLPTFAWDVNIGSVGVETDAVQNRPSRTFITRSEPADVETSWLQGYDARNGLLTVNSVRNALNHMGYLLKECQGYIKYQGDSSATPLLIDPLTALEIPGQLRGQALGPVKAFSQLVEPDGMPIRLLRDPGLLGDEVSVGPVTVSNNPAGGTNPLGLAVDIQGDAPTPLKLSFAAVGSQPTEIGAFVAYKSQPPSWTLYRQVEGGTLGTDTSSVSHAEYSGGAAASVSFATDASLVTRSTMTLSGLGLEGRTFDVWLHFWPSVTNPATAAYNIRGRWGTVDKTFTGATIPRTAISTSPPRLVRIGRLSLPASTTGWRYEIQMERTSVNGTAVMDYLLLVPAEEMLSYVYFPGGVTAGTAILDATTQDFVIDRGTRVTPIESKGSPSIVAEPGSGWISLVQGEAPQTIASTFTVSYTYRPRYYL